MLKNKNCIVTGGSRGIGRAVCECLSSNGANVALIYSGNDEAAENTCQRIHEKNPETVIKKYKCNVADFDEAGKTVKEIINDFGRIDVLINNAGITRDKLILSMTSEDFEQVVNVNLKGAFNFIKHLYSNFMKNRKGRIINMTSVSGLMGNAGQANYSSSKAGLIGLTKTVAKELASRNITCNAIAPGFVDTDMTGVLSEKTKEAAIGLIPLKRMAKPEEVAYLAAFLASDYAGYITGEVIKIDGGLYI